MRRLYVVVRGDLPPGLQLAQACHAAREFAVEHQPLSDGENLIALSVADELTLWRMVDDARRSAVPFTAFREPDLGGALTAAAFGSGARKYLSSLPLALRRTISADGAQMGAVAAGLVGGP